MLVKHNLLYSTGFRYPSYVGRENELRYKIEDGKVLIANSRTSFASFINGENYDIDDINSVYYIGFYGSLEGFCELRFSNDGYIKVNNKENFYYIESKGNLIAKPLHVNVVESSILNISDVAVYKEGIPGVYLPNINTLPQDKQPLFPPEGDYKEIQPQ